MNKKILLTSVCQPLGAAYGDAPSVGYELLHGQVTRAQGIFSPRALHLHFALDYISENIETPAVVLHYPTRSDLIRELRKGYDYVGVSFLLAVFHHMKDVVSLIREHAPQSKIILGGYGTVLSDEVLAPYSDYICRGEGVEFMRKLLGEPPASKPYKPPLIVSRLKIFSAPVSRTGMIFAGLGCPNGCDFCCTSHFFKRKHISLLPTGKDIYNVVERYQELEPGMPMVVLDEDFLLNKKRAMEFRECVLKGGKSVSLFVFASIRAISQYKVEEILEMGIDGFWIGYEGTKSGYNKQLGRPAEEIFKEFREHGITILASMIVGFPYQTPEIVEEELQGLLKLKPGLGQFLIYGPTPGTPFYERIMKEGLLRPDLLADQEKYYRSCDGFAAMVKHPRLSAEEIESLQRKCFEKDFQILGPSIYRFIETYMLGAQKLKNSSSPLLRKKSEWYASEVRKGYPIFLTGRLFGPNRAIRRWIGQLEKQIHSIYGRPNLKENLLSLASVVLAVWTGIKLKWNIFQHPKSIRNVYRAPLATPKLHQAWRRLKKMGIPLSVEHGSGNVVWVQFKQHFNAAQARDLGLQLRRALEKKKNRLVLDLAHLAHLEGKSAEQLARHLKDFRERIRLVVPAQFSHPNTALYLGIFDSRSASMMKETSSSQGDLAVSASSSRRV